MHTNAVAPGAGSDEILVVLTSLPDRDSAQKLARLLVEQRLAACVNVLDGCTSVYRWQDAIETVREVPVMIKTRRERFPGLQDAILAAHPYDVPEIVALTVHDGLPAYLGWVLAETT
ncbi:MAG: divalent-cation tolerance protein CutA [Burkholderiales bacterium]